MSAWEPSLPKILVVINDDKLRARILRLLAGCGTLVESGELPADGVLDLIVTDSPCPTLPRAEEAETREGQLTGVILIGQGDADVVLPADCTQRELSVSCRLLAEIVRLRRSHRNVVIERRVYRDQAMTDPLTGLANRRGWEEELSQRLSPIENDQPAAGCCVALLDLDHFARINESHGHPAGDEVLRLCAAALRANLRDADFVARLGGDEFAILIDAGHRQVAERICDRLRTAVSTAVSSSTPYSVSASIGCCWTAEAINADELYARASTALKQAKDAGRNRTVLQ